MHCGRCRSAFLLSNQRGFQGWGGGCPQGLFLCSFIQAKLTTTPCDRGYWCAMVKALGLPSARLHRRLSSKPNLAAPPSPHAKIFTAMALGFPALTSMANPLLASVSLSNVPLCEMPVCQKVFVWHSRLLLSRRRTATRHRVRASKRKAKLHFWTPILLFCQVDFGWSCAGSIE